jgi:hypothetical protein
MHRARMPIGFISRPRPNLLRGLTKRTYWPWVEDYLYMLSAGYGTGWG